MERRSTDEMLAQVPLFAGLSKSQLREISSLATRLDLPAGRNLTTQGATGKEFIIVLEGDVEVIVDGAVVATPTAGECYGEIALLDSRPDPAWIAARADSDHLKALGTRLGGREAIQALLINEKQLWPAVTQRERHLMRLPERVHGHRDGADRRRRIKGDDPLGIVAQGDRHPVALLDPVVAGHDRGEMA